MEIEITIKDENGEGRFNFDSYTNAIELLKAKQEKEIEKYLKEFKNNNE